MSRNNSGITKPPVQESQTDVIQDVMNAVKNLKSDYESLKKEHDRLLAENKSLKDENEMLKFDNEHLKERLRAEKRFNEVRFKPYNREINELRAKVAELEKQVKTQSENTESLLCELDKGKKQFASELLEVLGEFSNSDDKKKAETLIEDEEPAEFYSDFDYEDNEDTKEDNGGWWKVK